MNKIRIGVVGYGNLGKGAEKAVAGSKDQELVAVFSRRELEHSLYQPLAEITDWRDKVDVLLLCGGSATDLPEQGPALAAHFNLVDSFDTHARIPEYFEKVNAAATAAGKVAVISTGWDPGLFSIARVLGESILPHGREYTFWGRGVSQGHSDALRRVPGVRDARQYTIPSEAAMQRIRSGETPELTTRQKHTRQCFVVLEEGADAASVEREIVTMPNYFADYDTTVAHCDDPRPFPHISLSRSDIRNSDPRVPDVQPRTYFLESRTFSRTAHRPLERFRVRNLELQRNAPGSANRTRRSPIPLLKFE